VNTVSHIVNTKWQIVNKDSHIVNTKWQIVNTVNR